VPHSVSRTLSQTDTLKHLLDPIPKPLDSVEVAIETQILSSRQLVI
jgi:hypothetical protein